MGREGTRVEWRAGGRGRAGGAGGRGGRGGGERRAGEGGQGRDTRICDVTFPVTWLILIGLHDMSDVKWRPP